jgi:hypothetical protein
MSYMIAYKNSLGRIEYRLERGRMTTMDMADALLRRGDQLIGISQSDASREMPLSHADVEARRQKKAANCKAYGKNPYEGEEAWASNRLNARR